MIVPSKIKVVCPKCRYSPKKEIFIKIPISNYMMQYNKRKLMSIDCTVYGCDFSGDILEWLVIEYVLK